MKKINFKLLALQGMVLSALLSTQSLSALNIESNTTYLAGGGCGGGKGGGCGGGGSSGTKRYISMEDDTKATNAAEDATNASMKDKVSSTKTSTTSPQDTKAPADTNKGKMMQNEQNAPKGSGCPSRLQLLGKDHKSVMAEKRDALV